MLDKLMSQMGPMKDAMDQAKKKLDTMVLKVMPKGKWLFM